jgi:hypothetical protein
MWTLFEQNRIGALRLALAKAEISRRELGKA